MKFLKGLAISLLGILLFLSLSAFGLVLTINQTILNPDFVASEINRLDISSLAGEFFSEQISQQIPSGQIPQGEEIIGEVVADTLDDLEPWIKEQVNAMIYSIYDYLTGNTQSLSLVISTDELKKALEDSLEPVLLQSMPQLASLPPEVRDAAIAQYHEQLSGQIPATIDFGEYMMSPEVMSTLEQAREYIGYIQMAYKALIGIILVLIGLIVLIHRQVRGATRQLGITFMVYGIPGYIGIFAIKNYATQQLAQLTQSNLPATFQTWLPQFTDNLLAPLEMFCLGTLICGVVLLIVSFVYKPRVSSI